VAPVACANVAADVGRPAVDTTWKKSVAAHIQDPDKTGFNVAKDMLGSQVRYVMGSVYELDRLIPERFDHVFCLGLFYHLKHPVLAFEKIAGALDEGGHLFFEGECLRVYGEDAYYEDKYKQDPSNWFVPNFACLRGWLETAGFDVVRHFFIELRDYKPPSQRVVGVARKTRSRLRMENARSGTRTPTRTSADGSSRGRAHRFRFPGGSASPPRSAPGIRPACWRTRRSRNSICAFRLRRSSLAHRCTASSTAGSILSRNALRSDTGPGSY
jgi:hypothetical protein